MDNGTGQGEHGGLPWASVFDSAANMRALTAIQAEGLRAASELVDRFVRVAANGMSASGPTPSAPPLTQDQRADAFGATDMEPFLRTWWSLVGRYLLGPAGPQGAATPGSASQHNHTPDDTADFDLAHGRATGRLELQAPSDGTATAVVWLHNAAADDLGEIRLRCSDLQSGDGQLIAASAVQFQPEVVPMPGRCKRGIEITVSLGELAAPGTYRGTLFASGHPDVWMPVAVTVRAVAA